MPLEALCRKLVGLRCFRVRASRVTLLHDPTRFHRRLVEACESATKRSALYFGTGDPEREILGALRTACRRSPSLQVRVVLDGARGRRVESKASSVDVLDTLVEEFPDRVRLATWDYLPRRPRWLRVGWAAEIAAVFHIKAFAIDDEVILSGANLSVSYFTDRVDRYIRVVDATFAKWHHDLVDILGASSLCDVAKVEAHCRRETKKDFSVARCGKFAYLFPAAQLGDELRQEELAVRTVLETKGKIGLATAYLNPPRDVAQRLAGAVVIAPSIASHGFAEAPDVRKNVPKAYQMIARDLVRNQPNLELLEWHDDHKSFHAKGVWLFREGRRRRRSWTTTIVGSSNMNARARLRDLELSFVMTTNNRRLSRALKGEWSRFKRQASAPWSLLSPPRDVPLWVRVFRPQINTFL